ncbi:MAG: DUF4328 domain-containing protein [Labilithrix sp.]|nr:DUF4328 domain-containing protein [Labilithrix sp.]
MTNPYVQYAPPTAHQAHAYTGHGHHGYEPLGWKTTAAAITIALTIPAQLAANAALLASGPSLEEASPAAGLALVGAVVVVVGATILAAIFFLVWLNRAAKNVRAFGATGLQFTPGWCVGWWFVPFANLYKPFKAVQEVWRASDPDAAGSASDWLLRPAAPALGAWWATWIVSGFLDRISGKIDDTQLSATFGFASSFVSIVCAVLIISIMKKLAQRQELCWEKIMARRPL